MTIRDRLQRLLDEGQLVELYFAPGHNYFLAKLTRIGLDYVEFDAFDEEENMIAHNIMPLPLLAGITTCSSERNREKLDRLLKEEGEDASRRASS